MRSNLGIIGTGIEGATCAAAPVPSGTGITFSERGHHLAEKLACVCAVFSDFKNGTFQSKEMLVTPTLSAKALHVAHHIRQKDFAA